MVVSLQRHPAEQLLRTLQRALRSPCPYETVAVADEALALLAALGQPREALVGWRVVADHRPAFGFPYGFGLAGSAVCHALGRPDAFQGRNNVPGAPPLAPLAERVRGAALVTAAERCEELADGDEGALFGLLALLSPTTVGPRWTANPGRQQALPGLRHLLDATKLPARSRASLLLLGAELADELGERDLASRWLQAWFDERHHGHADVLTALALLGDRLRDLASQQTALFEERRPRHLTHVPL